MTHSHKVGDIVTFEYAGFKPKDFRVTKVDEHGWGMAPIDGDPTWEREPVPEPPPLTPQQHLAARLRAAFWAAADATFNDESIHDMDMPYFDEEKDTVDGHMPHQFWDHMATAWEAQ